MHVKLNIDNPFEDTKEKWSGHPFVQFNERKKNRMVFGEADFYTKNGFESIINEHYSIDGRYIFFYVTPERIRIYSDKSGFVKPYIRFDGKYLEVTTEPEVIYRNAQNFSKSGIYCYMELGYVPAPHCLYEGWNVIPPGFYAEVSSHKNSICFKKYWKVLRKKSFLTPNKFWQHFRAEIHSLDGYNSTEPTILLSGGIDSRLIAAAVDRPKKTCFVRMQGFIPDEQDATIIKSYPNYIKGNHREALIDLNNFEVAEAFLESTFVAIDHAHMGKWKFYLLLKRFAERNAQGIYLNGQTADTLLMRNIPGDNLTSRITRGIYSKVANIFTVPGMIPIIRFLARFLPLKKAIKLHQLLNAVGTPSYYSGYLLNPGFIPGKRNQPNVVDDILGSLTSELIDAYNGQVDFVISDLLLRTFIWGTDMRGIEDASKTFGLKMRFVFMQEKIMQMILNLSVYQNPQLGEYKSFLKKICNNIIPMKHLQHEPFVPREGQFGHLEQRLSQTALGQFLDNIQNTPKYNNFLKDIKFQFPDLLDTNQIRSQADTFIRYQRLCSLFLFYCFMQGDCPKTFMESQIKTTSSML